jgi:hypothetical protein
MRQIGRQSIGPKSGPGGLQGRSPWGKSYGQVSIELKISRVDFGASVRQGGDADWMTIKDVLEFLGFDIKIVNVVIAGDKDRPPGQSHFTGQRVTVVEMRRIQRDSSTRSSATRREATGGVRRRVS